MHCEQTRLRSCREGTQTSAGTVIAYGDRHLKPMAIVHHPNKGPTNSKLFRCKRVIRPLAAVVRGIWGHSRESRVLSPHTETPRAARQVLASACLLCSTAIRVYSEGQQILEARQEPPRAHISQTKLDLVRDMRRCGEGTKISVKPVLPVLDSTSLLEEVNQGTLC